MGFRPSRAEGRRSSAGGVSRLSWMDFVKAWRRYVDDRSPPPDAAPEGPPAGEDGAPLEGPLLLSVPPPPAAAEFAAALRAAGDLLALAQPRFGPTWERLRPRVEAAREAERERLYAAAVLRQVPELLEWAQADGEGETFLTLAELALQPVLRPFAATLVAGRNLAAWRHPFCPVCGREADVARIRPDNLRFLHCPVCDTEWPVTRLSCVWCGTDDPKKVQFLILEALQPWRVDTCEVCGGYMKTLDQRSGGPLAMPGVDLFVEDARTLQLDLLAQREGFRRGGRAH